MDDDWTYPDILPLIYREISVALNRNERVKRIVLRADWWEVYQRMTMLAGTPVECATEWMPMAFRVETEWRSAS